MALAQGVHLPVVFVVVRPGLLLQVLRHPFDDRPVVRFFVTEAHAVPFHGLFRAGEALHVAQQAAHREGADHLPAPVGPGDQLPDVLVPHLLMVRPEGLRRHTGGCRQLLREPAPVVGHVEQREPGDRPVLQLRDPLQFLHRVKPDAGGAHAGTDEHRQVVMQLLPPDVDIQQVRPVPGEGRRVLQVLRDAEPPRLQDLHRPVPFLQGVVPDPEVPVLPEIVPVFHISRSFHVHACEGSEEKVLSLPTGRCVLVFPSYRSGFGTLPFGRLSCGHRACPSRTLHRRYSVAIGIIPRFRDFVKTGFPGVPSVSLLTRKRICIMIYIQGNETSCCLQNDQIQE